MDDVEELAAENELLAAENERLQVEVKRLTDILHGQIDATEIVNVDIENGGVSIDFRPPHWAIRHIAASFIATIGKSPNWTSMEVGPIPGDGRSVIVTVRWKDGETPEESVVKLRDEVRRLRAMKWTGYVRIDQILHLFEVADDMVRFMKENRDFSTCTWIEKTECHYKQETASSGK